MAASLKRPKVVRIDYPINKAIYDDFIKLCTRTTYSPKVVIEKMMKKFTESNGQF